MFCLQFRLFCLTMKLKKLNTKLKMLYAKWPLQSTIFWRNWINSVPQAWATIFAFCFCIYPSSMDIGQVYIYVRGTYFPWQLGFPVGSAPPGRRPCLKLEMEIRDGSTNNLLSLAQSRKQRARKSFILSPPAPSAPPPHPPPHYQKHQWRMKPSSSDCMYVQSKVGWYSNFENRVYVRLINAKQKSETSFQNHFLYFEGFLQQLQYSRHILTLR